MIRRLFVILTITFERSSNDLRITFEPLVADHYFLKGILPKFLNAENAFKIKNISGDKGKKNARQEVLTCIYIG